MATKTNIFTQFAKEYIVYLSNLLEQLDLKEVDAFVSELENSCKDESTVFFAGNGGSASTASHMANDFSIGVGNCNGQRRIRAMALTDNVSVITAIANDSGYENVFVYQLRTHYRRGDKLVVISASGNSPNVVEAAAWVKERGGTVIGLTGFDGGKLKALCDIAIHVKTPKGEYGPVEDIHMILDHLIYSWLIYSE
ncbi:MAG: SIS domain-containing protein [Nitrospirae bacterium]|nr:SIS domain-containing protein [Nitrospirota bacterium]MBF0553590.1 SIS domain-containing protein [Nitrospirota bacterium]